jgi:hypothetical protein
MPAPVSETETRAMPPACAASTRIEPPRGV